MWAWQGGAAGGRTLGAGPHSFEKESKGVELQGTQRGNVVHTVGPDWQTG